MELPGRYLVDPGRILLVRTGLTAGAGIGQATTRAHLRSGESCLDVGCRRSSHCPTQPSRFAAEVVGHGSWGTVPGHQRRPHVLVAPLAAERTVIAPGGKDVPSRS